MKLPGQRIFRYGIICLWLGFAFLQPAAGGCRVPVGLPDVDSTYYLNAATIRGSRPLLDAGVVRTAFDSLALKENISLSFADVLAYNSSVFVKQYGRSTQSTVSFRGTSASHTQVLWNGMKINSPMLGMTDFSTIPAFLTDKAELLHGPSSLQAVSGGIGGAVLLSTGESTAEGFEMQFVQGLGSFWTVDDFLRLEYGGKRFHVSLRTVFSYSPNRFKYVNRDKKENILDEDMNIISSYYPTEYNENGKFRDWHLLLEGGYETKAGDKFSVSVWPSISYRQIPRLTVDYSQPGDFINEQNDRSLRAVASWRRSFGQADISVSAGWSGTDFGYDYAFDAGAGHWSDMTHSRSRTQTVSARADALWRLGRRWIFRAGADVCHHIVNSAEEVSGQGYEACRTDTELFASLSWKPSERVGVTFSVREAAAGGQFSLPIPVLNADWLLWKEAGLRLKGSAARNHRFPTLSDMYFLPGGNTDLRPETGWSYDVGWSLSKIWKKVGVSAEGTWFDSWIKDWIIWLPYGSTKNFFTPLNLLKVHSYGVEQKIDLKYRPAEDWALNFSGNFTWSPSINVSGTGRQGDSSAGKQLVYVPEYSSSFIASLSYRQWSLNYKWCWYSTRYVMSSNETGPSGTVPPYFMSDVTVTRGLNFKFADISLSLAVKNLFNESYCTVLSRPMPGINFEFFIGVTPKWNIKH